MTMMMADHGADVIMVEPANGVGETDARDRRNHKRRRVGSGFATSARGKRSLKLNLKDQLDWTCSCAWRTPLMSLSKRFGPGS